MLQFIRDKVVKVAIIVTLIMFVGLIFFDWGMSAYQSRKQSEAIGKVNDKEIPLNKFYQIYQRTLNDVEKNEELTIIKKKFVLDKVWQQIEENNLINDFFNKNNITVSSNEMIFFLKKNPPPEILNNPAFYTNNQFDTTKYYENFINNPEVLRQNEAYVRYLENVYRQHLLQYKLKNIVFYIPSMSKIDEQEYIFLKTHQAKLEYISTAYDLYRNINFSITKEDIKTYYKKNKELYKRNWLANCAYIKIPKKPSKLDTQLVLKDMQEALNELRKGRKFEEVAKEYSESKDVDSTGGSIGTIRDDFIPLKIKLALDSLKAGDITNIIKFGSGFYIYKIDSIKLTKAKDSTIHKSYTLKEIFMGIRMTTDTEDSLREALENIKEILSTNMDTLKYFNPDTTGYFEITKLVPKEGYIENLSSFIYNAEKGELSNILENDKNFYLFILLDKKEPGYYSLEEVAEDIKQILTKDSIKNYAKNYLYNKFLEAQKQKISLDSLAKTDNKIYYYKTDKYVNGLEYLPYVGYNNEFTYTIFNIESKKFTKPILTENYCVIGIKLSEQTVPLDTNNIKTEIRTNFYKKAKNFYDTWINLYKNNANIEDYRYKFF